MQQKRSRAICAGIALSLACGALTGISSRAKAQTAQGGPADALFACREIAQDQVRLACFDREAAALNEAEASSAVVIVKKEEIRKARRDLFGLSLPRIGLFRSGDNTDSTEDEDEIKLIDDFLGSFRIESSGRALFTLSNGARWMQTDNVPVLSEPKAGDDVRIERAALGSFMAVIGGRRAIRVKRIN